MKYPVRVTPLLRKLPSLSLILALGLFSYQAAAGLVLNPQRIVFQDKEKAASLELLNTDEVEGRYQIFFEQKRMLENGSIVDVPEAEQTGTYASKMIRYSPRRVDILGGGAQTLRLAVRRPRDLPDGEYLSHLVLKQIPNKVNSATETSSDEQGEKQLNLSVQPVLKLAIPVIVRKGELTASTDLSDIKLIPREDSNSVLQFTLHRSGNRSLYGDVEIYENMNGEMGKRIGFVRGIALYHETDKRLVNVQLNDTISPEANKLTVRFIENEKYGGDLKVEKELNLK